MAAALTRDWDAQRIRGHVATRSWDDVAQRVASQWLLAVNSFRSPAAEFSAKSTDDRIASAVRSPEA
jgi:hypothetical protein